MVSDRFTIGLVARALMLLVTLTLLAFSLVARHWYAVDAVLAVLATLQMLDLVRTVTRGNREIARFFDAIAYEDTTQSFAALARVSPYRELGESMGRVMERLRQGRGEREEMARYVSALLAHVPVALVARDEDGAYTALNTAARRLFDAGSGPLRGLSRYGEVFSNDLNGLKAGGRALLRLERGEGVLHLKAAATAFRSSGRLRTLISLQNIGEDLSAQELAAWHALIRTISHEVMNSLTPISSLSQTARELVASARQGVAPDSEAALSLQDANEALDAVARRSEGLLHFVQSHRRLTQRMSARPETVLVPRLFARLERLLGPEMEAHGIAFSTICTPASLILKADPELLDQALINLLRNAIDAVEGRSGARIGLGAARSAGLVRLTVSDNGPGVPADQRERIFVPFFTSKRQGTGVGLTLVRQITNLHGGSVGIKDVPGGGAEFVLTLPS